MIFLHRLIKTILIVFAIVFIVNAGLILTIANWRPEIKGSDAVIILGAAINTPALKNRTLEGLQLYEQGKADVMILSGGKISNADISEAEYMAKVINYETQGGAKYVLEDQSHTTYENIKNSKAKLGDSDSVIIVSDEFHLARAVLLAKRAGFETVYWSAPKPDYYSAKDLRYYYFREFLAMLNYIPKFLFG